MGRADRDSSRAAILVAIALTLLVVLCPFTPAESYTWVIYPDGSGEVPYIQNAIDLAAPGDTVLVKPGTYYDVFKISTTEYAGIVLRKSGVVVRSEGGPAATVIDFSDEAEGRLTRGAYCQDCDSTTVIEGFTFVADIEGLLEIGSGIYVLGGAPKILDNVFDQVEGYTGGPIRIDPGLTGPASPLFRGNRFEGSYTCCGAGGAMYVGTGCAPEIRENTFIGNVTALYGGAIAFVNASGLVVDNEFTNNTAIEGGAVYVQGSDPEIRGNTFTGNHAASSGPVGYGGAVAFTNSSGLFVENVLKENLADGSGGGLCIKDSSPEISATTIAENIAATAPGVGGVLVTGSSSPVFANVLVVGNQAGGIACEGGATPTFGCGDVFGNTGAAYAGCTDPTGQNGNRAVDPLLCADSLYLQDCSPLAAGASCGQIGARGIGCVCASTERHVSWGTVKVLYRD